MKYSSPSGEYAFSHPAGSGGDVARPLPIDALFVAPLNPSLLEVGYAPPFADVDFPAVYPPFAKGSPLL
jgi:hypothetical protein